MQTTTNYLLKKPDPSDAYDKQNDNGNMDLIDGQMKANADASLAAQQTADAAETPAGAQAKADTAEGNANAYTNTEITDVSGVGRTTETVKGNADAVAAHLADTMPHQFVDGLTTYRYGLKLNATSDGLVFVYEEVI